MSGDFVAFSAVLCCSGMSTAEVTGSSPLDASSRLFTTDASPKPGLLGVETFLTVPEGSTGSRLPLRTAATKSAQGCSSERDSLKVGSRPGGAGVSSSPSVLDR